MAGRSERIAEPTHSSEPAITVIQRERSDRRIYLVQRAVPDQVDPSRPLRGSLWMTVASARRINSAARLTSLHKHVLLVLQQRLAVLRPGRGHYVAELVAQGGHALVRRQVDD